MREISLCEFENLKIGNATDEKNATGVTAIVFPSGAPCGLDIRGGGPASRETHLLNPLSAADKIHAVVLGGGSAFGLDCAGGVMEYLEGMDIGFDTGFAKVPLVCTSCLYDLCVGSASVRPGKEMGKAAAQAAFEGGFCTGNAGAGTGATVGKLGGTEFMMKSGLGAYAIETDGLKVGAVVAVNALGDVYENGRIIAGMLNKTKDAFANSNAAMTGTTADRGNLFVSNTTIGAVFTNARFDKAQLNKIAAMAGNAYARAIRPVNTTADGDSIYAASLGGVEADINAIGTLCSDCMEQAIINAVKSAESAYGLKCAKDMEGLL